MDNKKSLNEVVGDAEQEPQKVLTEEEARIIREHLAACKETNS